jgi:hypothetical protein
MRRRRFAVPIGMALALTCLATPAPASAQAEYKVKPGGFKSRLFLEGSNGYSIIVSSAGHKHVELTALGDDGVVSYRAPGRASRDGIEADFGDFGRIALRFHGFPEKQKREQKANCRGKRTIGGPGTFRGEVEFEGEGGFTKIRARKARGFFFRSFRQVCKVRKAQAPDRRGPRKARPPRLSIEASTLLAESRDQGRRTRFSTTEIELRSGGRAAAVLTVVSGSSVERVGAVRISRENFTFAGNGVLLAGNPDREPELAKVLAPWPFTGTATYRKEVGSPPSWTGTLAVRFPGLGKVPLAGEGFGVVLCRNAPSFERCQGRLNGQGFDVADLRRWLAQGSGSQSQAFWDDRLSWSR